MTIYKCNVSRRATSRKSLPARAIPRLTLIKQLSDETESRRNKKYNRWQGKADTNRKCRVSLSGILQLGFSERNAVKSLGCNNLSCEHICRGAVRTQRTSKLFSPESQELRAERTIKVAFWIELRFVAHKAFYLKWISTSFRTKFTKRPLLLLDCWLFFVLTCFLLLCNKTLNVFSLVTNIYFVSLRVSMFPSTSSRGNIEPLRETK